MYGCVCVCVCVQIDCNMLMASAARAQNKWTEIRTDMCEWSMNAWLYQCVLVCVHVCVCACVWTLSRVTSQCHHLGQYSHVPNLTSLRRLLPFSAPGYVQPTPLSFPLCHNILSPTSPFFFLFPLSTSPPGTTFAARLSSLLRSTRGPKRWVSSLRWGWLAREGVAKLKVNTFCWRVAEYVCVCVRVCECECVYLC